MRSPFIALVVFFLVGCGAADAPAPSAPSPARTFTLNGVVRDARSNEPLAAAQLTIVSGNNVGLTTAGSASGAFSFAGIQSGPIVLRVSVNGYVAVERSIEVTANTVIDVTLTAAPTPPPVREEPTGPQVRTVSGRVIDKPIGGAIAGARVEILSGANRGQFVETDGNGVFQLGGIAAEQQIQIRAYKIGYFLDDRNVSLGRADVPGLEFTLERRRLT